MRFRARNVTRGTVLADEVEEAASVWARLKGLLGRGSLREEEGLHIVPCNAIHMLFMRFPIDVAFLDSERRVVKAISDVAPWRATRIHLGARSALELAAGTLVRTRTHEGDLLTFDRVA